MQVSDVLIKPIITEQSLTQAQGGWYTFRVHVDSNKYQIAGSVQTQFNVNVLEVRTITVKGKSKRVGKKRMQIQKSSTKKALVKLGKDQTIAVFEVGKQS